MRFGDFSHSALVRIAEEVCLQQHLLTLGSCSACGNGPTRSRLIITRKQLTGIAGLTAERIRAALGLPADLEGLATVLSVHPMFAPQQYVDRDIRFDGAETRAVYPPRWGGAHTDGAWPTLVDGEHLGALNALVRGVDPHFSVRVVAEDAVALIVEVIVESAPAKECGEVAITRFSSGASFVFADRGIPLPLTVV